MKQKDVLHVVGILMYLSIINAVPLTRLEREVFSGNSSSLANECVSEDIIYQAGDEVPSPGPCEQCVCKPPSVECTMIKCKTNSGCKMIQRANHCCPDYMCDCEYKGRIYNNGERLEREDTPCQVCYCKGGEIMCTSITCYERTDCQPRYVPGQCCPKYDHCPLETSGNSSGNSTVVGSKREIQPWLMGKQVTVKPIEVAKQSTTKSPEEHTQPQVYPQTLKIHEILPTTPKYERPNGKRPALSTVSKVPLEIHIEEKASPIVATSTESNVELVSSTESVKAEMDDDKSGTMSQYSTTMSDSIVQSSTVEESLGLSTTVGIISDTTSSPLVNLMTSDIPVEYSTVGIEQETTTTGTLPDLSYETIVKEDSLNGSKANLVDGSTLTENGVTSEVTSEWEKASTSESEIASTEGMELSTENYRIGSISSEGGSTNTIIINDGSTTAGDELGNYDMQYTSPDSLPVSEGETINPTLTSFTLKMEPLLLSGGIYDELNDTVLYTDDNDVKQDETTRHEDNQEFNPSTTENPDELSSYKSVGEPSALSQVFEKFVEIPESYLSSIRRSDDWLSENYQLVPGEGAESDERLLDLNVGATSHSDTRVSPSYYFGDSKESYLMSGRSLAPFTENNKDSYGEKTTSEGKFQSDINKLATEESVTSSSSESESEEDEKDKYNINDQSDLYLSITGKNSSSNETILHMILTPKDLKQLAAQIIKENSNRTESNLKETEVKIEWLTQEQLSKLKPESPRVNINLTKCNFTGFTELDLKSEKLKAIKNNLAHTTESELKSAADDNNKDLEVTTEGSASEISTILLTTISDLLESTTVSYASSTESSEQTSSESTESSSSVSEEPSSTVIPEKLGPDTSTIKVYEIRQSGNPNDKLSDLYITTEGPYGSDKNSPSESTFSLSNLPKSEITKRSESTNDESSTGSDSETTTSASSNSSDKPRQKNLPDVEPFLRQLPSTLDEKDVSILRDFLERHLSEPLSR